MILFRSLHVQIVEHRPVLKPTSREIKLLKGNMEFAEKIAGNKGRLWISQ